MTVPPLPDVPCVRVRCLWSDGVGAQHGGSRFYLSYTGSAPSAANCATLGGDVATAWGTDLASLIHSDYTLTEVDVLDIATRSGASSVSTVSVPGTRAGTPMSLNTCTNIEFDIARRYRGGKPRIFLPAGVQGDLQTLASWTSSFITACNTGITDFMAALEALSIGSMGTLQHVNLSYYSGFTNHTSTSGRERAVPTYRPTALHDNVEGYSTKAIVGSQRRRRTSLT